MNPFEKVSNLSRVVPAQLAYITFPLESRYQPVRVVSARPPPSENTTKTASSVALAVERYAGGGGILILPLADTRPDEEPDYVEFETAPVAPAAAPPAAQNPTPTTAGQHIALDGSAPEAER